MSSVNQIILIGRVGKEPEIRQFQTTQLVTISLATSEKYKTKAGEQKERTDWHSVAFFGKLGDVVINWVNKGSLIYVQGKLHYDKFQAKDGRDVYKTEIIAESLQLLGSKTKTDGKDWTKEETESNDDIPF